MRPDTTQNAIPPAGGNETRYTNYETWAQYTYDPIGTNHIICLVGDDGKRNWFYTSGQGDGMIQRAVIHPGESFVKEDGVWQDWTEAQVIPGLMEGDSDLVDLPVNDNFGIKAYYR